MAKKEKKILEVPFDNTGQMVRRWSKTWGTNNSTISYKPAENFEDTIKFFGLGWTSTNCYAVFNSKTSSKKYYMFIRDFEAMVKTQILKLGIISGTFQYVQRGSSYGIKIISVSKLDVLK